MEAIAAYFRFSERETDLATEIRAGVATFMVMVYIVAVNPGILSSAGIDPAAAAAATALIAGVMSIAMGVIANAPIALAAGLGINVIEGLVITVLVLVGLREAVMNAVPLVLKRAIGVGIGLFILFIGFVDGGLITKPPGTGPVPVQFVFPNT